jgi:putative ABC transport system ATP-binding protein
MIALRGITKSFSQGNGKPEVPVLRGVDLAVGEGEFVSILGPSGSGKSTLLYVTSGLQRQTAGTVEIGRRDLSDMSDNELTLFRRDNIGMIFQAYHLFPLLTAEENVMFPALVAGTPTRVVRQRARELLTKVGLEHRLSHRPAELSGGEQQRVAIARSLICNPKVLLADEPTGALDSRNGQEVLTLIGNLSDEIGLTVMMVTHDKVLAAQADRVITMRDGRVEDDTRTTGEVS